jgi:hypothetical protein
MADMRVRIPIALNRRRLGCLALLVVVDFLEVGIDHFIVATL